MGDYRELSQIDRIILLKRRAIQLRDNARNYWKWVEKELQESPSYDYVFVPGHYPTWSVAEHGPTKCLVNRMPGLMAKYRVTAYVAGHDHNMQLIQKDKCNYVVSGAGNFMDPSLR